MRDHSARPRFDFPPQPDYYCVLGSPISHSKSPRIHASFATQLGERLAYGAVQVTTDELRDALREFRERGGKGMNLTVPLKEVAARLADYPSERVLLAGAANTLRVDSEGHYHADNTDGIGLVRDLKHNHGIGIDDRDLLILGAGGAARGIIAPLLSEAPRSITIYNRNEDKASELADHFAALGTITASSTKALAKQPYDLIINATSASLEGVLPAVLSNDMGGDLGGDLIAKGGACYDLMYQNTPTVFVRWGLEHGASLSLDGLGMLVEQAAESFAIWRGTRPATAAVIASLRSK